jgi:hypothetical protein
MLVAKDIAAGAAGSTNGWTMVNGAAVYDRAQFVKGTVMNIELAGGGTVLALTRWSLWGGTALMVSASLAALALNWKTIVRAFSGLGQKKSADDPLARIEVPMKWMVIGLIPISILLVIVQYVAFDIAPWAGVIAIAMSFILSLVACRATGETDTTPIGAMGKVMQLLFAVIKPGAITPNLASAGVAANAASASADLLTDLKSGYLLGANPRKQFIAQFCGVFFGTLAVVPVWFLMIPNKAALEKFAAPATRQWAAVAEVLTQGLDKLPESARWAIDGAGAVVGHPVWQRDVLPDRRDPGLDMGECQPAPRGAVRGGAGQRPHRRREPDEGDPEHERDGDRAAGQDGRGRDAVTRAQAAHD